MDHRKSVRLKGMLIPDVGQRIRVQLDVIFVEHFEGARRVGSDVSRIALKSSKIPDGDYLLEFFHWTPIRERVRIKDGIIVENEKS